MDDDVEADELRASVRKQLFGDDVPVSIGRYRIQQRLGRGGMGIVYSAFDPQLDRRVALKVLRPGGRHRLDPDRAARLVREARAMARLSHPNVAAVYEVGSVGSKVYIALEFIEGTTLRRWLGAATRTWGEIVRHFIEAGQGLHAAHQAGLVHRDFKPDNVMVADDGRVRVLDFGLARANLPNPSTEGIPTGEPSSDEVDALTETGTVLGTPAYMAPEQGQLGVATPASDQYAYCVALHEAVFGVRPGQDPDGEPRAPAARVPPRLRRVLERGLAPAPEDRWSSMSALVEELRHLFARPRPWGWIATGALSLALAATAAVSLGQAPSASDDPCPDPAPRTAQVWNETRALRVDAAVDSAPPFARDAWPGARALLLRRLDGLRAAIQSSCEATKIHATQGEAAFAWRDQCFTAQLREIDAVLELVEAGEADAIQHIGSALGELDPVDACSEARAGRLPAAAPLPADLPRIQQLRIALAVASARQRTGQYAEAAAAAKTVVEDARQLGYKPLLAEALLGYANALRAAGRAEDAERGYYDAIETAEESRHDEITARAWTRLIAVQASDLGRLDDAERLLAPAHGAVKRLGEAPVLEADLWVVQGVVLRGQGDFARAIELHRRALSTYEEHYEPHHPAVSGTLHNLAKTLRHAGRSEEAAAPLKRSLALVRERVGPRHPDLARTIVSVGSNLGSRGRHEQAIKRFSTAIEILEESVGSTHPSLAVALHNRGNSLASLRRFEEALVDLERANEIDDATLGADNPERAASLYSLGLVYKFQRQLDRAEQTFLRALELQDRTWGKEHHNLAYPVSGLGAVAAARGEWRRAIDYFTRVRRLIRDGLGARHPRIVYPTVSSALAHAELGEHARAATLFEEAVAIGREGGNEPLEVAEAEFGLAKALVASAGDRSRAVQLARGARSSFAAAGEQGSRIVGEIDGWLAKNTRGR